MPMSIRRISLAYHLVFHAPFHCGTGLSVGLLDRTVWRDDDGFLSIPGATIKGLVRRGCEQVAHLLIDYLRHDLQISSVVLRIDSPHDVQAALRDYHPQTTLLARLFGTRVRPGSLYFDNAELSRSWKDFFAPIERSSDRSIFQSWQVEERIQVSMNRVTATARPGHLFTSEYGIQHLEFDGRIYGVLEDLEGRDIQNGTEMLSLALLLAGLLSVNHIGAQRSSGFGECTISVTSLTVNDEQIEDLEAYLRLLESISLYVMSMEEG